MEGKPLDNCKLTVFDPEEATTTPEKVGQPPSAVPGQTRAPAQRFQAATCDDI